MVLKLKLKYLVRVWGRKTLVNLQMMLTKVLSEEGKNLLDTVVI